MPLENQKTVILGAGISGISTGYHLKEKGIDSVIFEKDNDWGGLCGNFEIEGFRFDKAIHLSFTEDDYVKSLFAKSSDYIVHKPVSFNYYNGYWLKHPAQNNLFPLPASEKVKIIKDFIENNNKISGLKNYEEWLKAQYGDYFAINFPMRYTKKYWCCKSDNLSTTWVGNRMYAPNIEEVLMGAFTENTPNTYYAREMRYPIKGGYKSFLNNMKKKCDIRFNKNIIKIDSKNKRIYFEDGVVQEYQKLISSLPLPELGNIILDMPSKIKNACERLEYTSIALVSFGFKRKDIPKHLWFYIYDETIYPSRCYSPSLKAKDNAPENCSSLQFEVYFSKKKPLPISKDRLIEHIISQSEKMGLFSRDDILIRDFRILKYGNVVFNHGMEDDRNLIDNYMGKISIKCIGRFGRWDYLWSDQSLTNGIDKIF